MGKETMYRGKQIDNGKWTYGYLFKIWERAYILWGTTNDVPNMVEVDPQTVGECTGLNDRNGKEIYEGDILSNGQHINWIVFYDEASFKVKHEGSITRDCWVLSRDMAENREVIGTIYDPTESA